MIFHFGLSLFWLADFWHLQDLDLRELLADERLEIDLRHDVVVVRLDFAQILRDLLDNLIKDIILLEADIIILILLRKMWIL